MEKSFGPEVFTKEESEPGFYDYFVERYGEPPEIIETKRDREQLWRFQGDMIEHAKELVGRSGKPTMTKEQIFDALQRQGIVVIEEPYGKLSSEGKDGECKGAFDIQQGGTVYRLRVAPVEEYEYMESNGMPRDEAELYRWKVIGHEAGHAADKKFLGIGRKGADRWATEVRQIEFNRQFDLVCRNDGLAQEAIDFFHDLKNRGKIIKSS